MSKKSSHKGSAFERQIAKQFGQWWCYDPFAFSRSPGSGSRATVNIGAQLHPGDIVPAKATAANFPIALELKKREEWDIFNCFRGAKAELVKTPLIKYWIQTLSQCIQEGEVRYLPWLVVAKNHYTPLLIVDPWMFESQDLTTFCPLLEFQFRGKLIFSCLPLEAMLGQYSVNWHARLGALREDAVYRVELKKLYAYLTEK